MAERINISTVENKPSDYSQYTRANFYLDQILPYQKERFAMAYQEAQNQIKNDQDKQTYRLAFIQSLDQSISQSNAIKSSYLLQYNQATDDAQKQAVDQSFQEQVSRFNAKNNIDLSNATTGRSISTALIGAQSNYEQSLIQAGAKVNAGQNAIEKQNIQTLAEAERNGSLKNDLTTFSTIMKNPLSAKDTEQSYQALQGSASDLLNHARQVGEPLPLNELANSIAEAKDFNVIQSALQSVQPNLSPEEYQTLTHKVMALKDIPTGSLGVSSGTSSTQGMKLAGGYINPSSANAPFTAPTGQELEQGRNRAAFYSQQVIPQINDLDQQAASLQARRDALMNSVLQYQVPNTIQAAQQLNGQMFGAPAIHRKPTAQFSISQPQDIAPLSGPSPERLITPVPVQYQKAQAASTVSGHHGIKIQQQSTLPVRPPESPAQGPNIPNPQPYQYRGPNYGPDQPPWVFPGSVKYGPGQVQDFPPTYQDSPSQAQSQPEGSSVYQLLHSLLNPSNLKSTTKVGGYAEQPSTKVGGYVPAPAIENPVAPSNGRLDIQDLLNHSHYALPPAPIKPGSLPPSGAQTPSAPPDLKSETGGSGQSALNEAKQQKADFINQSLKTAQEYQSKPELVDRLLKNDPVSRSAAIVYRTNKENNKPLTDTVSTVMSAYQGDPTSQQKALAAIFYLSHQSQTSGRIPTA